MSAIAVLYFSRANDTAPVADTLLDNTGAAVNLTGASVAFHAIDRLGTVIVNKAATGPGGGAFDTTGKVQFTPAASDTATPGTYFVEWEVTFAGGSVQSWPQTDAAFWQIAPDFI